MGDIPHLPIADGTNLYLASMIDLGSGKLAGWRVADRTGIPGVSLSGARWMSERKILATGADTVNYEHKPKLSVPALDVHVHLLVEEGIPIMECLNLEQLARDQVYEFFFTAAALRIGGSSGSPIRPLAFVGSD